MRKVILVLCCVFALAGAWLFWPRGGAPSPGRSPAAAVASAPGAVARPGVAVPENTGSPSAAGTNQLAFRLANTSKASTPQGYDELTRAPHAILLENASIDTDTKLELNLPSHLRAAGDPGAFIVQARGAIDGAFRAQLMAAGAQIVSYIPNNAFLVRLPSAGVPALAANARIQAVLPYEPYYKISSAMPAGTMPQPSAAAAAKISSPPRPTLLDLAVKQKPLPAGTYLTLGLFRDGAAATEAQIVNLGGVIVGRDRSPFGPIVRVQAPADWLALARLPGVQIVEPAHLRVSANDLSRPTLGVSATSVSPTNYLNLSGSNVLVEVNDTGIDAGHPDLTGRVSFDFTGSTNDTDGHGTFVAGQIAGDGTMSATVTNASGSIMPGTNGQFRGQAPLARLFSVGGIGTRGGVNDTDLADRIDLGGNDTNFFYYGLTNFFIPGPSIYLHHNAYLAPPYPDWYLQEAPAVTNALISNNSWNNGDAAYDLAAASYDAATRDALPEVTGPQSVLFVFSAGNYGGGNNLGNGGNSDSILSPATAKNVITVGALEQFRSITNTYLPLDSTNPVAAWYPGTDSGSQVASYSSRGNVGIGTEGSYGRFKPDVIAPGSSVVSTRSGQWDELAYYNPTNYEFNGENAGQIIDTNSGGFGFYQMSIPANAVGVILYARPNNLSPVPFPQLKFCLTSGDGSTLDPADPTTFDFAATTNTVAIPPDGGAGYLQTLITSGLAFAVVDTTNIPVNFDLVEEIIATNSNGNYYQVLSNLNNSLSGGPPNYYRYETGTSMAAADVSGVLALMQDFFTNTLHAAPSPALLKAMLINGARVAGTYGYAVTNGLNLQGWGLVNLPNSIPPSLTNTAAGAATSLFFVDQNPTNVLATGDRLTYNITVPAASQGQPLRITLAWTDPPGNPAAALKLVNSLGLVVTNLANGRVYYGNNFASSSPPYSLGLQTNSAPVFDPVNNVQNIVIPPTLATNYSLTIIGRSVNVNAVTTQATNLVQDFALVVSSDAAGNTNGIAVAAATPAPVPSLSPLVTGVNGTNGVLFDQLVGASGPLVSTNSIGFGTNSGYAVNAVLFPGQTNQWHFYAITNTTTFTNAAFVTFIPSTLSIPRLGVFAGSDANSTLPEANLDLFVASPLGTPAGDPQASGLTNLNPLVISNCMNGVSGDRAALARGGTKFVYYTDSQQGQVYYVGVQCEDQMAAEYGFLGVFSQNPFSTQDTNGNVYVNGLNLPVQIPDGDNRHPGVGYVFGLCVQPIEVRTAIVTNAITHQNFGDLLGFLSHGNEYATLNNHDSLGAVVDRNFIYDDSGQGGVFGARPSDGPGTLKNFIGTQGAGLWLLTELDDAQAHIGQVDNFSMKIEPHIPVGAGGTTNVVTVPAGGWFYDYVDVPVGYTNLTVFAADLTQPYPSPVLLALQFNVEPTLSNNIAIVGLTNGPLQNTNAISYGPPLTFGRYFIGLYNPDTVDRTVSFGVTLGFSASAESVVDFASAGPVPLLDDAVTYDYITNYDHADLIGAFSVGLRVDHPRISDLVFHLISPDGTRYLLMENRGSDSTNGCGATVITTNIINVTANGTAQPNTNYVNTGSTSGIFPITYNFYTAKDQMTVYYGTNVATNTLIFDTGVTNNPPGGGGGPQNTLPVTINVPYGPTNGVTSTYLTIVMDQFPTNFPGGTNRADFWTYTVGGVQTNYEYLTFTENTNLTTTPIKFAPPPLVPQTVFSLVMTDSFDAYAPGTYTPALGFGGWTVATNQVEIVTAPPPFDGANSLQLDHGVVVTNLPTVPGQTYALTYELGTRLAEGGGISTNAHWQSQTYSFTASATNTSLVLAASADSLAGLVFTNAQTLIFDTNALLDDLALIPVAGRLYYQAEQSLDSLIGSRSYGVWQLEVMDNRAGATNNATLLSWQLEFTFANTNFTIPPINFTNSGPQTNFLPGGSIQWFLINVPTNADFATNELLFATLPLNMWFSTNAPPTITNNPGDVQLLSGVTSGSATLGTNGSAANLPYAPAYFIPGGTYYIGIQNPNAAGATYAFDVVFHLLPEIPSVITEPATNITATTATLNALVNPEGAATMLYFEYGLTTNSWLYSSGLLLTNNLTTTNYWGIDVTNLVPGSIYYFQAIATNSVGTNYGGILTFTNPVGGPVPFSFTEPATLLTGSGAQLNGMATPNGNLAMAWFEWGTSRGYGLTTPLVNVGSNSAVAFVTNRISGLFTNLPYHYRLVVSNAVGVAYGFDQVFDQANAVAWGANFFGQVTVPAVLTNLVVGIGAGYDFSLAVNNDGTVVAWGDNTFGQTNVPAGLNNAVAVSGGEKDSLALRGDRTVLVWGSNQFKQTNAPADLTNIVAASSGGYHCLALRDTGDVVAWGLNAAGQTNVPAGLTNVVAIAGGDLHSVALKNDGTVVAWGYNNDNETNVPAGLTNVVAIAAGYYHNLALKSDGTVVAWGYNADGETIVPGNLTNVIAIAGGGFHSLALKSDGKLVVWGDNSSGQFNYPTNLINVTALAGGGLHSLALSSVFGLNQTNNPPFWTNGVNNSTVTMDEMTVTNVINTATDTNNPAQMLTYNLVNSPGWATIDAAGVITLSPVEVDGPGTNTITTVVTDNGFPAMSATNQFTVVVNEVNTPPYWPTNVPGQTNYTINELATLTVTNPASDSDVPANPLTYTLSVSPAAVNAVVDTNGIITWTPTEAQGPGVYTFTTVATDTNPWALFNQSLSSTNRFTVTVLEVNQAPFWTNAFPVVTMDELTTNSVVATAQDADLPANTLTYALATNSPAWAVIDTNSGIITLTPQEVDGPGTNTLTVVVTDNGVPPLSATTNFTVVVNEVNVAPTLILPPDTNILAQAPFIARATATDPDIPTNALTFALVSGPSGLTVSTNGVIAWTPSVSQLGTNLVAISVTDTNPFALFNQSLSVTNHFAITVTASPANVVIAGIIRTNIGGTNGFLITWFAPTNDQFHLQWTADLLPVNWHTFNGVISFDSFLTATNSRFSYFDDGTQSGGFSPTRFYRLQLLDSPTNTAPFFLVPGPATNYVVTPLAAFAVTNAAGDWDQPAQILTYFVTNSLAGTNVAIITSGGVISWTPALAQAGATNLITTVVTDNGLPPLSVTNFFTVIIPAPVTNAVPFTGVSYGTNGLALQWGAGDTNLFQVQWTTNLMPVVWSAFTNLITSTNGVFSFVDDGSQSGGLGLMKFYRIIEFP